MRESRQTLRAIHIHDPYKHTQPLTVTHTLVPNTITLHHTLLCAVHSQTHPTLHMHPHTSENHPHITYHKHSPHHTHPSHISDTHVSLTITRTYPSLTPSSHNPIFPHPTYMHPHIPHIPVIQHSTHKHPYFYPHVSAHSQFPVPRISPHSPPIVTYILKQNNLNKKQHIYSSLHTVTHIYIHIPYSQTHTAHNAYTQRDALKHIPQSYTHKHLSPCVQIHVCPHIPHSHT